MVFTIFNAYNHVNRLYNSDSVYKEIELQKALKRHGRSRSLVHYLNAERDIRHLVWKHRDNENIRFCGTFHKPPDKLAWRVSDPKYVSQLDGAIAVGINQVTYIQEQLKIEKVRYIPHGIHKDFFVPDVKKRVPNRLLFVGQHMRDFEALNYCIPILSERIKDLSVHIVLHPAYEKKIIPHSSIKMFTALNDEILLREYQEASALFLPMIDSTACNSILEAMACGLPIITNDVGGNSEYLKDTDAILVSRADHDSMIEYSSQLLQDEAKIEHCSRLSRMKAESYDWPLIVDKIKDFHDELWLDN